MGLAVREWWITEPTKVTKVSRHAVSQYIARSQCKSTDGVRGKLLDWFERGERVRRIGLAHVGALARHGETDWRRFGGWILVAAGDTITTVYQATQGKWETVKT